MSVTALPWVRADLALLLHTGGKGGDFWQEGAPSFR